MRQARKKSINAAFVFSKVSAVALFCVVKAVLQSSAEKAAYITLG